MSTVLQLATYVGTPLALIGFLAALGFYFYSRRLRSKENHQQGEKELILSLPDDKRQTVIEQYLANLGVPIADLSRAAREKICFQMMDDKKTELDKRYRQNFNFAVISAIVFVVCFVSATVAFVIKDDSANSNSGKGGISRDNQPASEKKMSHLSLSLQGSQLLARSNRNLGQKSFEGESVEQVTDQAAEWVKKTLGDTFPPSGELLPIKAHVRVDHHGEDHRFVIEPADPLRQDRLWIFTGEVKVGHQNLDLSGEATAAQITAARNRARQEAATLANKKGHSPPAPEQIGVTGLVIHLDRPGYDLRLLNYDLRRIGSPETVTTTLKRLPEPALTVIVDGIAGSDLAGELLRAKLRSLNLKAGGLEDLRAKEAEYKKSMVPDLSDEARLSFLRTARVDAFVSGTYMEK